jgi:glycosyltransferase involved in cell wall biosynthesis
MSIAQVTPDYHPHIGGVESSVHSLSKELKALGHEITVFTAQFDKSLPKEETYDGINIVRTKQLMNIYLTPITPRLKQDILKDDWDIVHTHAPPPLSSYYIAKAKMRAEKDGRGFPLIMTYHCDLEIPIRFGNFITDIYRYTYGNYTLKRCDRVLVSTETYAATSKAVWNSHAKVIPLGVDIKRFNPENKGDSIREKYGIGNSKVVMFVGRLAFHKGVNHLIEAAGLYRDAKYLIVGSGPKESALKRMAAASPNSKNIIFAGKVEKKDLPSYYAACDILVLPSVSRLEAFGLVTLEALSSGKPVITSDMPGMREVVVDGVDGFLAEPLNPHDIAEKIKKLLEDDQLRKKFGANGRLKVEERFTWPRVTKLVERTYHKVIEKRKRRSSR